MVLSWSRRCPVRVQSPAIYKTWQSGGGGGGMQQQAVCLLHKLPRQVAYCLRCCIGGGEARCGGGRSAEAEVFLILLFLGTLAL